MVSVNQLTYRKNLGMSFEKVGLLSSTDLGTKYSGSVGLSKSTQALATLRLPN